MEFNLPRIELESPIRQSLTLAYCYLGCVVITYLQKILPLQLFRGRRLLDKLLIKRIKTIKRVFYFSKKTLKSFIKFVKNMRGDKTLSNDDSNFTLIAP